MVINILIFFQTFLVFNLFFDKKIIKYFKHPDDKRSLYHMKYRFYIMYLGPVMFLFRRKILKENTISYLEYLVETYELYKEWSKTVRVEVTKDDYLVAKRKLKLMKLNIK